MDYKQDFMNIINFLKILNFEERYDTEKLYKIYNIIKNDNIDNITIYNNILNLLCKEKIILRNKDELFLKKLFKIINIVKNIDFKNDDIFDIEIELNYFFYKNIDENTYKIINFYKEQLKNQDHIILYRELWNKFLSPFADKIIDIELEYYIEYMKETNINKVKNINSNIIKNYFHKLVSNNIKKLKYTENLNKEILFFILLFEQF